MQKFFVHSILGMWTFNLSDYFNIFENYSNLIKMLPIRQKVQLIESICN